MNNRAFETDLQISEEMDYYNLVLTHNVDLQN